MFFPRAPGEPTSSGQNPFFVPWKKKRRSDDGGGGGFLRKHKQRSPLFARKRRQGTKVAFSPARAPLEQKRTTIATHTHTKFKDCIIVVVVVIIIIVVNQYLSLSLSLLFFDRAGVSPVEKEGHHARRFPPPPILWCAALAEEGARGVRTPLCTSQKS